MYEDWTKLVEAETKLADVRVSVGPVSLQAGLGSGEGQLFWTPPTPDGFLEFDVKLDEPGNYQLMLVATHSFDYGTFQVELDGKPLGKPINLYNASIISKEIRLQTPKLEAGKHTLRFVNVGKDGVSAGYFFGLDSFMFTR